MEELSILELASKGGWIMIVLALMSVVAVYIFVERFLAIRNAGKDDKLFMDRIRDYIKNNDVKSAVNFCRVTNTAATTDMSASTIIIHPPFDASSRMLSSSILI